MSSPGLALLHAISRFGVYAGVKVLNRNVEELKESSPDYVDEADFEQRLDHYKVAYQTVEVRLKSLDRAIAFLQLGIGVTSMSLFTL